MCFQTDNDRVNPFRLMVVVHSRVSSSSSPLSLRKSLMRSLTLLARVLTNLSYDNGENHSSLIFLNLFQIQNYVQLN